MTDFENTIELAYYESKDNPVTAFLIEQKGSEKVNLLVPGQKNDAWLYSLSKDKTSYNVVHQPKNMLKVLSGDAEPPVENFFTQIKVTPVVISKEYHASLIVTTPSFLLSNPAEYLMSLLKDKKKAEF